MEPVLGVRQIRPGLYAITSESEPRSGLSRLWRHVRRLVLGRPLPSRLERAERLGIFGAVALIGSDMIASSVYGPEEMVRRLGEAGPGGVALAFPVAMGIGVLLVILTLSYQQTISAYPSGAGGYIVASQNLGPLLGIISAAALLIDYTLDVAVSIATGVQSVTSAMPQMASSRVWRVWLRCSRSARFLPSPCRKAGMVHFWRRHQKPGRHWRMMVNAVGAMTTAVVLVVVLSSKFQHGAWLVVVALPALTFVIYRLGQHQQRLRHTAAIQPDRAEPLVEAVEGHMRHHVIVPVADTDRVALQAIAYITSLLGDGTGQNNADGTTIVEAVHITDDRERGEQLQRRWQHIGLTVPLVILESPYRATAEALLRYLDYLLRDPDRRTVVTVVIPETLPTRWWHPLLRNYFAWRLKWSLLFRPGVTVLSVPLLIPD